MANKPVLDTRFCVVWKPQSANFLQNRSNKFSFLDYTWHLHLCYDNNLRIYLNNDTERDFTQNGFCVTTFIEKDVPNISPFHPIAKSIFFNLPIKRLSCAKLFDVKRSNILEHFPDFSIPSRNSSECKIVCLFHNVPCTTTPCQVKTEACIQENKITFHGLESLSLDFCSLLENETISDVKLQCEDCSFSAHRAVLAARSKVFAAMFQNEMLENKTGTVEVSDMDAHDLELFLWYLYSGVIPNLSDDTLSRLYAAGDKYAVLHLMKACSVQIVGKLTEKNCLHHLKMADLHSDKDLKGEVVNFIVEHVGVLKSPEWSKFKEEQPKLAVHVYEIAMHERYFKHQASNG